ncbi:hypothetical protein C5167_006650 [Papaver somniferum]|uniref:Uncharacterized protein n=1 Tax=Papaver somniferum TaxID=3469 RepID=A0A4Y7JFN3_PAPSO|nr:hypothetical protein C5167_006650 [Papaver somniferum]
MIELRISDKLCHLLGIVPSRYCSKIIGSALVFGFGCIVGASILVVTATIFMFPSISSSQMNPMLQNDLNLYYHQSSSPHCSQYSSSKIPAPLAASPSPSPSTLPPPPLFPPFPLRGSPPTAPPPPRESPSFPPFPGSPPPIPPPRESPSPLPSPSNTPSLPPALPPPGSPPLSLRNIFENSTDDNQTGSTYTVNSHYNSSVLSINDPPEFRNSGDTKVNLLSTVVSTFSSDSSNVSSGDDSESFDGDCDIYDGEWVRDVNREPYYALGSCPYIEKQPFDCYLNGKRDNDYLKWQWQWKSQPTNIRCNKNIPSVFDGTDFLERLRGKKLVFSGDSLNRNMFESLVCMLWNVVPDKTKVVRPSMQSEYKTRGDLSLIFEASFDYNCTIAYVWSAFLVNETNSKTRRSRERELKPERETLRLDQIDGLAASVYQDADVVVFDSYHWWVDGKTNNGQVSRNIKERVFEMMLAYRRALMSWRRWIDNNIDSTKTQVVFRGFSLSHYEGGKWNTGGKCNLETEPITNKEKYINPSALQVKILEDTLRKMKTPVIYMNVSKLTYYRSDAHPSLYGKNYTSQERSGAMLIQDCSHWCLPGVPDTWNELLYVSLLKAGKGSFGGR